MATTPNMSLVLPTPTVTPGPDYATQLNTAFSTVDSHTHVPGQGVQVPVAGLNINADLPLGGNNLTTVRTTRFNSQAAALALTTDRNCFYVVNGDLYYNDASGNQVRMTAAGAVNVASSGNITGMGATTATATYASGSSTFTFNSNTSTPANFAVGPLTIGRNTASSFTVSLTPNSGQVSNYGLTFPSAAPSVSNSFVTCDTSGQLFFTALTKTLLPAVSQTVSSTVTFSTSSTTLVDVTNATVTKVTVGRPVMVTFQPMVSTINSGQVQLGNSNAIFGSCQISLLRDGVIIASWYMPCPPGSGVVVPIFTPPFLDIGASAGGHTWKLQALVDAGTRTLAITNMTLAAYEL